MNYFVIQGVLGEKVFYWSNRAWVALEEATKYKTREIAQKRLREILVQDLHREFTTGKPRRVTVEEITVTYSIVCKPKTYIGGIQNVI